MDLQHIRHIFFDLDHTLWDFDKNSEKAFATIFKTHHPTINTDRFIKHYVPINQACWALYQVDKITHQDLKYKRLKDTFDALAYPISDTEIDLLSHLYLEYLPDFNHLFDGALEVLSYLSNHYELHIITNGFAQIQDRKMENSGLKPFFKTITNSEMAGVKKPHPLIFEHALTEAKATKTESIMIGDCLIADVQGALDFGIQALFFNPFEAPVPKNVVQINKLQELKNLFAI